MDKKNLKARKTNWSSDKVVVIRRRKKPVPPTLAKSDPNLIQNQESQVKVKKKSSQGQPEVKLGSKKGPKGPKGRVKKTEPVKLTKEQRKRHKMRVKGRRLLKEIDPMIRKVLPKNIPYKIGIHSELLGYLEAMYPGKRTALRNAIGAFMKRETESYRYIKAISEGKYRYGFNCRKFPISDEDRKSATKKVKVKDNWAHRYEKWKKSQSSHKKRERTDSMETTKLKKK